MHTGVVCWWNWPNWRSRLNRLGCRMLTIGIIAIISFQLFNISVETHNPTTAVKHHIGVFNISRQNVLALILPPIAERVKTHQLWITKYGRDLFFCHSPLHGLLYLCRRIHAHGKHHHARDRNSHHASFLHKPIRFLKVYRQNLANMLPCQWT